jgi:dTDP-D-glucose 4,6-dehydratase
MKVFLIGGTGFMGTAVLPLLINSDKIEHIIMMFRDKTTFNPEMQELVKNSKIELVKGDVLKTESM